MAYNSLSNFTSISKFEYMQVRNKHIYLLLLLGCCKSPDFTRFSYIQHNNFQLPQIAGPKIVGRSAVAPLALHP